MMYPKVVDGRGALDAVPYEVRWRRPGVLANTHALDLQVRSGCGGLHKRVRRVMGRPGAGKLRVQSAMLLTHSRL
jgi:hypothetical protein